MPDCSSIQKSLAWCQGRPQYTGIRRRLYFTARSNIVTWPTLEKDSNGRVLSAVYDGDFILAADKEWLYMDILPDKSQLTSEAQGEYPAQSQLNKLVAVHPGIGLDAAEAAAWFNNNETVFLVEDMSGNMRVVGHKDYPIKVTVTQDTGQGITGSAGTTITVEASDDVPAPFYHYEGLFMTGDGRAVMYAVEATPETFTQI
jgi:hypothetical protein